MDTRGRTLWTIKQGTGCHILRWVPHWGKPKTEYGYLREEQAIITHKYATINNVIPKELNKILAVVSNFWPLWHLCCDSAKGGWKNMHPSDLHPSRCCLSSVLDLNFRWWILRTSNTWTSIQWQLFLFHRVMRLVGHLLDCRLSRLSATPASITHQDLRLRCHLMTTEKEICLSLVKSHKYVFSSIESRSTC